MLSRLHLLRTATGLALVGLLLTGCQSSQVSYPRAHHTELAEGESLSFTADLRSAYVLEKDGRRWLIAEPAPDAAFSYEAAEEGDIALVNVGGRNGADEAMTAGSEDLPLTGRTAYVLLARELSYRLIEAAYNMDADLDDFERMYDRMLSSVEKIAIAEGGQLTQDHRIAIGETITSEMSSPEALPDPGTGTAIAEAVLDEH